MELRNLTDCFQFVAIGDSSLEIFFQMKMSPSHTKYCCLNIHDKTLDTLHQETDGIQNITYVPNVAHMINLTTLIDFLINAKYYIGAKCCK